MNPDVDGAIGRLRAEGVLSEAQAARFLRVARRELVSVRFELKALLYAGVLLLTSGIGLFIREHHDRLGPAAIGTVVGLAAAACLARVMKTSPAFSWTEVAAPDVSFDYVLLLGVLLLAADMAYFEVQVKLFGASWPYHFLIVAAVYLLAAYRWDSRAVLALALTSFAAWRGVSVNVARGVLEPRTMEATRWNAIACGALFLGGAVASAAWKKKAHFESVWANMGLLLLLGALLSGVFGERESWPFWLLVLLLIASAAVWISFRLGRLLSFAMGVVAAYLGLLRFLFEALRHAKALAFLLTALSGIGVLVILVAAHRRMKTRS